MTESMILRRTFFIDQTKGAHERPSSRCRTAVISFAAIVSFRITRGRVRSRRFENVIAEVERLAANGFKEVVLTGIHLSSYGVILRKLACAQADTGGERSKGHRAHQAWVTRA